MLAFHDPHRPTGLPAGSAEKIELMRSRVELGLDPCHPLDTRDRDPSEGQWKDIQRQSWRQMGLTDYEGMRLTALVDWLDRNGPMPIEDVTRLTKRTEQKLRRLAKASGRITIRRGIVSLAASEA